MSWKRKRRLSVANMIYTCAVGVLVLIFGNILLLNSEFVGYVGDDLDSNHNERHSDDLVANDWRNLESNTKRRKLMQNRRLQDNILLDIDVNNKNVENLAFETHKALVETSQCHEISAITKREYLGSGWTKAVYKGTYKGEEVAVKVVDTSGHDMVTCEEEGNPFDQCYIRTSDKMIREILLLQGLSHPNIIKSLVFCVPAEPYDSTNASLVSMVTELGDAIDIIKLLQLSWEDRLRITYGITKMIHYLAHSPYGSLAVNDFQRQQFILVGGEIKLTDLDDLGFNEPRCTNHQQCSYYDPSANFTIMSQCIDGHCKDLNEKKNIFNAGRHFTNFLLPHGAPKAFHSQIEEVMTSYSNVTQLTSELYRQMQKIVHQYMSGSYLNRTNDQSYVPKYKVLRESDLPGEFDYRCPMSVSTSICTVSVYDRREAEEICDADPSCRGFVLSGRTWSGRMLAHLKNGIGMASRDKKATLCLKP